ncbi:hypothetical protein [Williamsia muralis]|uniref:hypothetical protein n=1 Tax=Williamsia marianensis TaxID=85044 RepID=UPI000DE60F8D|nr:hypothetical protein [Williamsia marianensis]PVY33807.1 Mce-associated membrane protein [Williamsia marianensis]
MADKDVSPPAGVGDDADQPSAKKVPSGKSRRSKPVVAESTGTSGSATSSSAKSSAASAAASPGAETTQARQITISVSAIGKVAAGALLIALIAVTVFFGLKWKSDQDKITAAEDAKQASDYFVTQLLNSMNTTTAGEYVDTMSPLTTGQFRDNLLKEREKTQADITQMQLKITPSIWSSGVVSAEKDSATTLIIAEITGTSSVATTPVTNVGMFRLTLEKHDGKWLVSQMDPGPSSSGAGSADSGAPVDPNAPADPNASVVPNAPVEPAPVTPAPAG